MDSQGGGNVCFCPVDPDGQPTAAPSKEPTTSLAFDTHSVKSTVAWDCTRYTKCHSRLAFHKGPLFLINDFIYIK